MATPPPGERTTDIASLEVSDFLNFQQLETKRTYLRPRNRLCEEVERGMGKIGEITLELDKDAKKASKESLNNLFSYVNKGKNEITILEEAKRATKVKVTIETA